ncbi:MAG: tectonin domain-containing protein, partial [Acidimicrobiales bacterium]
MSRELLVHASDLDAARQELSAVGGRPLHVLSDQLLVVTLTDDVPLASVPSPVLGVARDDDATGAPHGRGVDLTVRPRDPGTGASPAGRGPSRHGVGHAWLCASRRSSCPGRCRWPTGPDGAIDRHPHEPDPDRFGRRGRGHRVGDGHAAPLGPVKGALQRVSAASDGTVWGVNAGNQIFRRRPEFWEQVPGSLKQVSVGSASQ